MSQTQSLWEVGVPYVAAYAASTCGNATQCTTP